MRAIDLYCGIGGWSLGLTLAGIDVVASYERWRPAVETYRKNLKRNAIETDIRELDLRKLPHDIDLVVGSPPCTEFSYSNRGGNGNISEGLLDIEKMLAIVQAINPRYWVLENVPRVGKIIRKEMSKKNGPLYRYRKLLEGDDAHITIVDMANYGLPQKRRRCIAGRFPLELLESYRCGVQRTLGDVLSSLQTDVVHDPIYGIRLPKARITGQKPELALTVEERRINGDAKRHHPVYNKMTFPDVASRPSRTVTATCTRVSRESIIVRDPNDNKSLRRLTLRERACIQGFPVTYQLFGRSLSECEKMIGNAIPPLFSYYVGCAIQNTQRSDLKNLHDLTARLPVADSQAPEHEAGKRSVVRYSSHRRFRATVPNLRFRSGVRFELKNEVKSGGVARWWVEFVYGTPSDIRVLCLDSGVLRSLYSGRTYKMLMIDFKQEVQRLSGILTPERVRAIQKVWTHRVDGLAKQERLGPYKAVDEIGHSAKHLVGVCRSARASAYEEVVRLLKVSGCNRWHQQKIKDNAEGVYVGILLGSRVNRLLHASNV